MAPFPARPPVIPRAWTLAHSWSSKTVARESNRTSSRLLERDAGLDERGGAAGLGLTIVQDVLDAYGWELLPSACSQLQLRPRPSLRRRPDSCSIRVRTSLSSKCPPIRRSAHRLRLGRSE